MFKSILIKKNNLKKSINLFYFIRFNGKLINNRNIFINQLDNQPLFTNSIKLNNILTNKLNTKLNNLNKDYKSEDCLNNDTSIINELNSTQLNDLILNETQLEIFSKQINEFKRELDLFKFIKLKLNKIESDELNIIYKKIIDLYFENKKNNEIKLRLSLLSKPLFNRTEELITKLDSECLINCLKYYSLLNLDLENEFIKKLFKILVFKSKNNELNLNEICDLLNLYNYLNLNLIMNNQKMLFDFLMTFKLKLLNDAKDKILNNEFDFTNSQLLIDLICVFSDKSRWIEDNYKILNILIENLSLEENVIEINFKQSIKLLKEFKNLSFRNDESKLNDYFYDLIRLCNLKIYEQLTLEPNDLDFKFYLLNLHNKLDPLNNKVFSLIYDYKILSILSLHICNNKDKYYDKQLIFNLIQNYSKFNILNKNLLEFIYYQFYKQSNNLLNTNDSLLKNKINNFLLFSRYRLPFVDYNQFSYLLFNLNDQNFHDELNFKINSFHLLPHLILTDVQNLELINFILDKILTFKKPDYLEYLKSSNYEKINLAKIYLELFGKFNKEIIHNLTNKLNLILDNKLSRFKPKYSNHEYLDNKFLLKRNVFLSNGLFIKNLISIYDRSLNKLLPLNENYSQYFNSIDKINLNDNQELFVFIESRYIKGNTNFELNSNYQLKRILNLFRINTIDVYKEEYQNLSLDDQAKFFIKIALSSYNLSSNDDNLN